MRASSVNQLRLEPFPQEDVQHSVEASLARDFRDTTPADAVRQIRPEPQR